MVIKVRSSFEGEKMQTQYEAFRYRIDLYFSDFELEIEIDENGHNDRNIDYEIKTQKAIEQELDCKLIWIGPDKEDVDIFKAINEAFRHIKESTKKH